MKTILLGYRDERGLTAPRILAGPDIPVSEQANLFHAAKRLNQFPKGIVRVEQCVISEDCEIAIQIKSAPKPE